MQSRTKKPLEGAQRAFIIGLIIWIFLQMSRAIAFQLVGEINAGGESKAWMYPAYLDLFAVVCAPPLIWAVARRRGLTTWSLVVVYWAISIVDHVGNFVTTSVVGPPSIAEGMNPVLVPAVQTALDLVFVVLLFVPRYRSLFFQLQTPITPLETQ